MAPPVASLGDWAAGVVRSAGYPGLSAIMVLEHVVPSIPSEVVLPLVGVEVARGRASFLLALLAATLGSLGGALVLYALGRYGGRTLLLRHRRTLRLDEDRLERVERAFARHADLVVLGGRLVPGVRSLVSIPPGLLRMSVVRYAVLTTAGSLAWNAALITAGRQLGASWERLEPLLGTVSVVVPVALGAATLALVALWVARRR